MIFKKALCRHSSHAKLNKQREDRELTERCNKEWIYMKTKSIYIKYKKEREKMPQFILC